jgi:hypothetical protein
MKPYLFWNDPIFPQEHGFEDRGLLSREYFASLAMQAFISVAKEGDSPEMIAKASVVLADALIAELNKKAESNES